MYVNFGVCVMMSTLWHLIVCLSVSVMLINFYVGRSLGGMDKILVKRIMPYGRYLVGKRRLFVNLNV